MTQQTKTKAPEDPTLWLEWADDVLSSATHAGPPMIDPPRGTTRTWAFFDSYWNVSVYTAYYEHDMVPDLFQPDDFSWDMLVYAGLVSPVPTKSCVFSSMGVGR